MHLRDLRTLHIVQVKVTQDMQKKSHVDRCLTKSRSMHTFVIATPGQ